MVVVGFVFRQSVMGFVFCLLVLEGLGEGLRVLFMEILTSIPLEVPFSRYSDTH